MNILIKIAYDGTRYNGWQRQINGIGVQQKIEEAFFKLLRVKINILAASRTDTGVHALGQMATFKSDTNIPLEMIPIAVNTHLPRDIRVLEAKAVSDLFHPTLDAKRKTYEYKIQNVRVANPLLTNYSEFIYKKLDYDKMVKASRYFIGEHDFVGFCSAKTKAMSTIRTIYGIDLNITDGIDKNGFIITATITGNGFLYNMVRIIAGTLIYVGLGKINVDDMKSIILSKDRNRAGITAGAQGLTLLRVEY